MMTTLTVLATLVAVPFLFRVLLAGHPGRGHGPAFCARLGAGVALRIGAARRATGRVGMKVCLQCGRCVPCATPRTNSRPATSR